MREFRVPFSKIDNSQTITPEMERQFKEQGLDLHMNDVVELIDDHDTGERVLKVSNTKYFTPK